tara:strand:+ start:1154 stop:1981 length:828 start_codon:yes stop_codon:yes gene_type:complete
MTKVIAEIGINHNGDVDAAESLIRLAAIAGCQYAKFQKRNPDTCVPEHQKGELRDTPWGTLTYLDYKKKIEFGHTEYSHLFRFAKRCGVEIFASVWDTLSIDFMSQYTKVMKIPSALLTDLETGKYARERSELLMVSTGMSTEEEIETFVEECNPDVIFHTNSAYPSPIEDLQLSYITRLKEKYPDKVIGYSGHEYGLSTTFAAVALGAKIVERHITLDRTLWGSDQLSSVEPSGLFKLVKGIKDIDVAMGEEKPREVAESELSKRHSLRKEVKC